jgi:transposase-like protein
MTPALLERVGLAMYGEHWIAKLAYALDNAPRTVSRWASGYSEIPSGLTGELQTLLAARAAELAAVRADLEAIARAMTPD